MKPMAAASGYRRGPTASGAPPAAAIPRIRHPTRAVLVCGPPGGGKADYCRRHAGPDDLILDPADSAARMGLGDSLAPAGRGNSTRIAADQLGRLAELNGKIPRVWIIRAAPRLETRTAWLKSLGQRSSVKLLIPAKATAIRRIWQDDQRNPHRRAELTELCMRWYAEFTEA